MYLKDENNATGTMYGKVIGTIYGNVIVTIHGNPIQCVLLLKSL